MPLSANAIKTLRQKYPDAKPSNDTMMLHGPFNYVNEKIFDGTNADLVRKCTIRTKGSHGPSELDPGPEAPLILLFIYIQLPRWESVFDYIRFILARYYKFVRGLYNFLFNLSCYMKIVF